MAGFSLQDKHYVLHFLYIICNKCYNKFNHRYVLDIQRGQDSCSLTINQTEYIYILYNHNDIYRPMKLTL